MKIYTILSVLMVAVIASGCASAAAETGSAAAAKVQAFAAQHSPENADPASGLTQAANGQYPTSPEGVVEAFLVIYETDPQAARSYLTSDAQAAFDPALLQFDANMDGFAIDQAGVNPGLARVNPGPELPGAFIGVGIQVAGREIRRDFTLGMENGQWKIETITAPPG
ncbi:MAG: hypothetical protein ROW39_09300 [Anaerolineaceae bacterium]|jgi:uncharacterized protein YceK